MAASGVECKVTWTQFSDMCNTIADHARRYQEIPVKAVFGIPNGGIYPAIAIAKELKVPVVPVPGPNTLIVDDVIDSGETMEKYVRLIGVHPTMRLAALCVKTSAPKWVDSGVITGDFPVFSAWVVFPWETARDESAPTSNVRRILQYIGEDPNRDGLKETPHRVVKALKEMTGGYKEKPEDILSKTFDEPYDEVVISSGIPFTSLCEHHMLPFSGTADVGYIPGKVVGLSKLARLVDCFARRLQIQEKMTRQIADSIQTALQARGVAVVIKAEHSCMACRGVKKSGTKMVTSAMLGAFRDKPEARQEFLALCQ